MLYEYILVVETTYNLFIVFFEVLPSVNIYLPSKYNHALLPVYHWCKTCSYSQLKSKTLSFCVTTMSKLQQNWFTHELNLPMDHHNRFYPSTNCDNCMTCFSLRTAININLIQIYRFTLKIHNYFISSRMNKYI